MLTQKTEKFSGESYDCEVETGCRVVIRDGHPIIRDELQELIMAIAISNNIRTSGTYFFIVLSFRYKKDFRYVHSIVA